MMPSIKQRSANPMYYFLEAAGTAAGGGSLVSTVSTLVMLVAMVLGTPPTCL